jgi:hypothetical protein
VILPRRPMIIFNETVIAGMVLLLIPFLKGSTLSAAVEKFSSTAGGALTPRSSHPELPLSVGLGARQSARFAGQSCVASKVLSRLWISFSTACLSISRGSNCCEITGRVVSRSMRRPAYARGPTVRSFGSLDRAQCYPIRFFERY